MSALYPLFLRLDGRRVVLVGGGALAAGKLAGLREAGASVTVVAPEIRDELRLDGVTLVERAFVPSDLDGAHLVVAAATQKVNARVAQAAAERRIFVNAVDDVDAASAFGGGVVRRGGVTIAISTDGAAPALAGLLREGLDAVLPDDLGDWVETGRVVRSLWKEAAVPIPGRRPLLLRAINDIYESRRGPS